MTYCILARRTQDINTLLRPPYIPPHLRYLSTWHIHLDVQHLHTHSHPPTPIPPPSSPSPTLPLPSTQTGLTSILHPLILPSHNLARSDKSACASFMPLVPKYCM